MLGLLTAAAVIRPAGTVSPRASRPNAATCALSCAACDAVRSPVDRDAVVADAPRDARSAVVSGSSPSTFTNALASAASFTRLRIVARFSSRSHLASSHAAPMACAGSSRYSFANVYQCFGLRSPPGVGGGVRPATAVTAPSNIVAVPHDARPADTSHPSRAVRARSSFERRDSRGGAFSTLTEPRSDQNFRGRPEKPRPKGTPSLPTTPWRREARPSRS